MGVVIRANNRKCPIELSMSYGSFQYFRKGIGDALAKDAYEKWFATDNKTSWNIIKEVCKNLHNAVGDAVYTFLTEDDCIGKLTHKECKEVYESVKDIHVDGMFECVYCRSSFDDFKKLLQYCYSHRTNLIWN